MEDRELDITLFQTELERLHIDLDQKQLDQFIQYYRLLIQWNKVMNLTGITEWEEVVIKHFIDSLTIVKVCEMEKIHRVIDIGTGAGFPGIPLKIAFPHLEITLLDSLKKRIGFLNEVIDKLGMDRIDTIHGRAEDFAKQKEYRQGYDLCVSRAVASLNILSEYCIPFVKTGGYFIPYKSGKVEEELISSEKALKILGGRVLSREKFYLGENDMERSLLVIKKEKETPKKYPRKAGMPSKEPL